MILKLLRTDLQSEWQAIFIAAVASLAMWIATTGVVMPRYTTAGSMIIGLLPFPILILATRLRREAQMRRRLLAQLPVTATAIRIARWLRHFTIVAIACLIGVAALLFSPPAPDWGWTGFARDAYQTIAVLTSWVAAARIFESCSAMRTPFNHIFGVTAVWFFLALWGVTAWFLKASFVDDATVPWTLFLQVTAGSVLALILVDILLDRFADSRVS